MAVERERQMLLRDYEAMQKAYKELEAKKRSLLEDQVCNCINYTLVCSLACYPVLPDHSCCVVRKCRLCLNQSYHYRYQQM